MAKKSGAEKKRGIEKEDYLQEWDVEAEGESWFLGIGINDYQEFPPLSNAVKDVMDILEVLTRKYGLKSTQCLTFFNEEANEENILDALERLAIQTKSQDKVLIYYSGHGHLNRKTNIGYWIPQDAKINRVSSYIPNSTIRDYIRAIHSRHILLISDSCFSGSLFARGSKRSYPEPEELLERRDSRYAICSGRHDEEVADGPAGGNSPFARSILAVLEENRAPLLRTSLLGERVIDLTASAYRQLPIHGALFGVGHQGGQYVFHLIADEERDWEACLAQATAAAYRHFLEKHPAGKRAGEARRQLEKLEAETAWERAQKEDSLPAYRAFLDAHPGSPFAGKAREWVQFLEEEAAWQQAGATHTILAYYQYHKQYPNGRYTKEAWERIEELEQEANWQEAREKDTLAAYRHYLAAYPSGKYHEEAAGRIQALINARMEAMAWKQAIAEGTAIALQLFLEEFPGSRFSTEAASRLEQLEQKDRRGRDKKEPAKAGPPPSDTERPALIFGAAGPATTSAGESAFPLITIAGAGWMAANFDRETPGSLCYDHNPALCQKYGRLYTWEAAVEACPKGWRLPSVEEWEALIDHFGGEKEAYRALARGGSSQFDALFGGYCNADGQFFHLGDYGYYWSSTEKNATHAWYYYFDHSYGRLFRGSRPKQTFRSCRYVQNPA